MEQAVNQFNKGLQMDTNPMVQGDDTLSDALNATFITMNGNEVILQNDMGNRRVDGAFLPPGYQPVGMKEYGGIIYVAAYNPITNRSQIGSFPSPERNIQPDEFDGKKFINLDQVYNFETRVPNCFYKQEEEGIYFLVNRSFLIPITDDTSLHAGDKFTIYSTQLYTPLIKYYHRISRRATVEISESEYSGHENDPMYFNKIIPWGTFVSNFDNITGEKVTSPKNKKYTLAVGVMNSQHEFVDITKSLVRWDENGKIINTSEDSELIKFNKGYFIAPIKTSVDNTINDNKFIENRQISALNTYSFKLVGPLYLKATLNTIESFSYKLILSKEGNNIIVKIIADISYNCPDGVFLEEDDNNFGYSSLEEGEISSLFTGFDFFTKKIDENTNIKYIKEEITNHINLETKPETKYDINTNLYHVQMTKTYTLSESNYPDGIIKYYICVSDCPDYYIKELSHKGEIDILLINSGTVNLDEWNYNWDNGILNYELLLYPTASETYQDLYLHYQNITEEGSSEEQVLLIKGDLGQGVIYQSYKKLKDLEPNSMYLCSLSYTSVSANSVVKSIGNIEIAEGNHTDKKLWIMTTPFFDKETRKDFFNINEVYVSHNFDAKLKVNEENITYNEYEKIPYVPSQTEVNEFDFTNTINCEIPISTTYNNQTTLKDIPEEVAVLDFNGQEIRFNIDQYISTYDTLETQTKGDITDWDDEGKTEIDFTIEQLSLKLYFNFEPFYGFPIRPTELRNYVNSIVYTYGSDNTEITYSGSDLKQEMIIPFQGGVQSSLKINLKGGHELSILYADIEAEAVFSEDFSEITFSRGTPGNPYIEYNIDDYSSSTHHAPSIHDSTTTSFNYVIEGIQNHTLNATFKQPALFSASQQKVVVRNYLTSAKDALIKLIDKQLVAPQVEIEYFTNEGKFCLEKSNDSATNVFERLDSPETIKLESFEPTRNNTYNQKPNVTEITESNANWDIRDNDRILYAGVGMDLSSENNFSEENQQNDWVKGMVIRVWLQYKSNDSIPRWALLYEKETVYNGVWIENYNDHKFQFKDVGSALKTSKLLDSTLKYYGKFSNEIREIEDLWAINKINYYFISEIGIQVTLDYTYEIPPNSIEITNILLNNGYTVNQIPEFILQTPASELMTKSTQFNLYSNRQESTEFASDMNKLLTNGSYIDYWSDNPIFNKHLNEIEPDNTLFKIKRTACPNTYYIYIGLNAPEDTKYSEEFKEWEKGGNINHYYTDVWLEIGKDINNFEWNNFDENTSDDEKYYIPLNVPYTSNAFHEVYIAIPCQQNNNNLLNVIFVEQNNSNAIDISEKQPIDTITYRNVLYNVYEIVKEGSDWIILYPKISSINLEESNVEQSEENSNKIIDEQWNNKYLYGNTISEGFWPSLPVTTDEVEYLKYMYQFDQSNTSNGSPMLDLTHCPKINIEIENNT